MSSAIPARRAARGGRVTTTSPARGSIRRLMRRARVERRQRTGHDMAWACCPPGRATVSASI
ncbi:hypothetical protein [Siccirubricoccus sp. G192]|uniref:hypothetical protein n=1 Tax=Siccirubricoccus sp. G192 TaxID=2849651 RepID=UPI0020C1E785|nr:hypothetical protein [Siccirubricoccus sp. G192]